MSYIYFKPLNLTPFLYVMIVCVLQDQMRAIDMIQKDPELGSLDVIEAPLVDVEIRGIPALQFMGDMVWK